ncbi:Glu-tRNA(Gln) amidotransferase subunit GatD [Candidatus Pacearchaeota archaeon]|nr:Glu-tRNA(Gln) amidotransferase subunit GatD [Candidatus Pacearchaeota archaeon]
MKKVVKLKKVEKTKTQEIQKISGSRNFKEISRLAKKSNLDYSIGDKINVIADKEYDGIVFESYDPKIILIKLKSGYNVGVEKSKIKQIKILEKAKIKPEMKIKTHGNKVSGAQKARLSSEVPYNPNLKKIIVLHTGGTIASKLDYQSGGVVAKFSAEDLIEMVPEIAKIANIETELISNFMSEDMMFSDYQKIISAIKKHEHKCDGIIIGHGTDTLGYTSAALAFACQDINIPIILIGSQRSSDRGSSDANSNLLSAATFIAKSDFVGVAICMHNLSSDDICAILPPTKTRKMHTTRRDAFKAINDTPIALVNSRNGEILYFKNHDKKTGHGKGIFLDKFDEGVGLLKTHPNMKNSLFEFYTKNYKAIVIEATGLGHTPTNLGKNLKNYETLKKFIKKGGIVAITSQCIYGRVNQYVYTNLRRLSDIGCIFCGDMLSETAFIKLSWLLGNYKKDEAQKLLIRNLRGELNEKSLYKEDFVE